jgi:hypothetical protein
MKSLFLAIACVGGSLACAFLSHRPPALPRLAAIPDHVDFGTRHQGESLATQFQLVNESSVDLTITDVWTTCDCAKPSLKSKRLGPGESVVLSTTWDLGARRGDATTTMNVYHRLAGKPGLQSLILKLSSHVIPEFNHAPEDLSFFSGVAATKSVLFRSTQPNKVSLKQAYCTHRAFASRMANNGARVDVTFCPDLWKDREGRAELVLVTDSSLEAARRVPLLVQSASGNSQNVSSKRSAHK